MGGRSRRSSRASSPRGDIVFHVVSDEEVVGNGTREIVERAPAADVTLSLEPTELRLCAAEGGLVHFRIEVEGVEAHASTRYLSVHAGGRGGGGVNAIEKTLKIIAALQELERQWANDEVASDPAAGLRHAARPGSSSAGPGGGCRRPAEPLLERRHDAELLLGRIQHVVVPGRGRTTTSRPRSRRSSRAVARADPWLREHPPRFTWKLGSIYFPPLDVPLDHPAVRHARRLPRRASGSIAAPQGFGAATDLAWYGERRLPGIICGPGRLAQCHVADEYLETEQLALAAKVYAQMLVDWCA